jgi:hypothetical protein
VGERWLAEGETEWGHVLATRYAIVLPSGRRHAEFHETM